VKIAPSILAADFARLGEQGSRRSRGRADRIHVDVMDGHFVRNISMGAPMVASLRPVTRLAIETHLMITDPDRKSNYANRNDWSWKNGRQHGAEASQGRPRMCGVRHVAEAVEELVAEKAAGAADLRDMVKKLKAPRAVWLMVPAAVVDKSISSLVPLLEAGDTIIDGGNSYYIDDIRRAKELSSKGFTTSTSAQAAACGDWSEATA